ncbi:SRPBCC family protein [Kangiella sp. M94]
MRIITFLFFVFATATTKAEVTEVSEQHFVISINIAIDAPSRQVYDQFIQIGQWWQDSHTWFGDASKMTIKPKAGGCFCERNGEQQAVHMTLSQINPGKSVHMTGGLGPLSSLAVNGYMTWNFEATEDNKTKLKLNYRVTGFVNQKTVDWAKAVDGVLMQQVSNLKTKFKH